MQLDWEIWIDTNISPIIANGWLKRSVWSSNPRQLWERIQAGVVEGVKILMTSDVAIVKLIN